MCVLRPALGENPGVVVFWGVVLRASGLSVCSLNVVVWGVVEGFRSVQFFLYIELLQAVYCCRLRGLQGRR